MTIEVLKNKKILILGFAREGRDVLKFLRAHFPEKVFGIADQKTSLPNLPKKRIRVHLGKNYLKALRQYDVVVRSPGVPIRMLSPLLKKGQQLTSETDLFFSVCQGTIVGITGTKGKSTTASLIYSILKKGGKKAKLVGNIGRPALGFLARQSPQDIFVFELSSAQLEGLKQSPHVAVLLNVYAEHLNHHGSFAKYVRAKANIARHQSRGDFFIYNRESKIASRIAKLSKARKIPFSPKSNPGFLAPLEPAILVGRLFGVAEGTIKDAMYAFKPLSHRLEYIGTFKGICFVNDSLATIPEATMGALDLMGNQAATLIAGGYDRGVNMNKLAKRIEKSPLQTLILFPDTGKKILYALKKKPKNVFEVKTMKEAVRLCYGHTPKGKTCLLSPAASSFNLFKDYEDRGNQFTKYVKQYGPKA